MVTAESVKARLRGLIDKINNKTGANDTDLTTAVDTMLGQSGGRVGELTQYAKFVATPESSTSFTITNPLGGIAQKVFVRRTTTDATSSRKVQKCIVDAGFGIGAMELIDTSGSTRYVTRMVSGTPNNGEFAISDGKIVLYRYNSANAFDNQNAYDVEIYQ